MTFATQAANADQQQPQDEDPKNQTTDNVFLELGERKFNNKEDVITKITNQDSHIKTVEEENAALRDQLKELSENKETNDDVIKELERMKQEITEGSLTTDKVKDLVNESLTTSKQEELKVSNHKQCENALREAYGDNYITKLAEQAASLDISLDEADDLARKNPKVFLRTFVVDKTPSFSSSNNTQMSQGNNNTAQFREQAESGYEVKSPLGLRSTKERTNNFIAALQDKVAHTN